MFDELTNVGLELQTVAIVCMWTVTLIRAPAAIRVPAQRGLWVAVAMAASAMTIRSKVLVTALFDLFGQNHLVPLAGNLFGVVASAAIVDFAMTAVGFRRRAGLLYGTVAAVLVTMTILDITAPEHLHHQIPASGYPAPSPAYWLVAGVTNISANLVCMTVCLLYSRRGESRSLRIALSLFGIGAALFGAFWISYTIHLFARFALVPALIPLVIGCGGLLYAAATSIPLVFAALSRLRDLRSFWRLWPIWSELTEAVPHVTLTRAISRRRALLLSSTALRLSLYRIVIEIRDAILILRDYVEPHQVLDVRRAVGSCPEHAEPAVTAHWLRLARQAKLDGAPARSHPLNVTSLGGANLPTEIAFLLEVAKVYRDAA
ncbi:MAB_1171c family putative transporter [Amycolatopsis anabasis]|uniref:MAB_1171c family putative transporter n=1 Tax=Amycolatopsis anabasis TaxID=1840409 RepID=UPI00131E1AAD|nr:MAB_1171c family putative transporter [Amycolatopsis anabasis]